MQQQSRVSSSLLRVLGLGFLGLIVIFVCIIPFFSTFAYMFELVEEQEVGVQFRQGQIHDVVGPGVYSDFGLYVDLVKVSSQAIPFEVTDQELITKDKQRIGLVVAGFILRPGIAEKDIIQTNWAQYRGIYTDDDAARTRVESLAKQAMKVCVGDRTFEASVVGTARDELRTCIDTELDELAKTSGGLKIESLVVPDVILSAEVQAALDAFVQSRLATEKAAQDELKAEAEAAAEQARQEGEIRVEQSRIQEQTRQQTLLAQLEQERLSAQLAIIEAERANELAQLETTNAVIEATKDNELLAAQKDIEINAALAEAAEAKARAALAEQLVAAELYQQYPEYLELQLAIANASALKATDKIIFTQEGMIPNLVIPGPGIVPTVDATPITPNPQ